MSKVKFVLNRAGVRDLLRSNEMMSVVSEKANQALGSLGDGYEVNTLTGVNRVNAEIVAVTYAARKENSQNNTILKALGGSK